VDAAGDEGNAIKFLIERIAEPNGEIVHRLVYNDNVSV